MPARERPPDRARPVAVRRTPPPLPLPGRRPAQGIADVDVAHAREKLPRAYHFGSQGPGDVFSNHASHTNRLIPFYVFGRKADLGAVTGKNSVYRDADRLKALYGFLPEHTVNPDADYADQSDLYRVQADAVAKGVKHLFIVWFDGLDWPTTPAAAVAKTGKVYTEGKGPGPSSRTTPPTVRRSSVTSSPARPTTRTCPTSTRRRSRSRRQGLSGGYDVRIAGPNPWTLGPLVAKAPGYLKGQSADERDKQGVADAGGVLHAYTDSAPSAAEFVSGRKAYNNGINVTDDGPFVPTLFHQVQAKGWKVGTVTSVPFDHASPAAMYAHDVHRDDYQDLARDMLGLRAIGAVAGKDAAPPGPRRRDRHRFRAGGPAGRPPRARARTA